MKCQAFQVIVIRCQADGRGPKEKEKNFHSLELELF